MSHVSNRPANASAEGTARTDDLPPPALPEIQVLREPERNDFPVGAGIADTHLLEDPAANAPARKGQADAALIGERIKSLNQFFDQLPGSHPRYRVLELIGRGGMGAVFKAEQRAPVKRLVALKLVKPGFDSRDVIARFESERQALARMDHGSVAKVLDAGADDKGRPYFVMEYVPGIAITEFADQNKLSIKTRLELFMDVCAAIAHAHSKGIIHRDIKASNVLACFSEGKAVVKVIDFGIAKALAGDRLTDLTMNTRMGQPMGTYESMSPEQAEGSPDIDTRTDVYSLGVLLYELLAGAAPFDHALFAKAADQEIRRIIREVEPPRPSMRLSSMGDAGTKIAMARQSPLDALANELRTELEWIPLMAMRKSRERRYATPLEMAADIRRYLEHRPLRAGPESWTYILRKGLRRHRVAIAAATAILLSLAGGLTVGTYLLARTMRAEAATARERDLIERAVALPGDMEAARKDFISARRTHNVALDGLLTQNRTSPAVLAGLTEIESSDAGEIPLLGAFGEDGGIPAFRGHAQKPNNVAVIPGGRRALTAGIDGQLFLWDLLTGRVIAHQMPVRKTPPNNLAYVAASSDGKFAVAGGADGTLRFWDADTLAPQPTVLTADGAGIYMVAISPGSRRVVAGTASGQLWVWDNDGEWSHINTLDVTNHESIPAIAFLPNDERFVVIGDEGGILRVCDLQDRTFFSPTPAVHHNGVKVNCVVISGDGTKAASAGFDGNVILWDLHGTGAATTISFGHVLEHLPSPLRVWRVAFSPNGTLVAAGLNDGRIAVYNTKTYDRVRLFQAHRRQSMGVAFVDDTLLLSTGDDTYASDGATLVSALRLWDLSDRSMVFPAADKGRAKKVTVEDTGHVMIRTTSNESFDAYLGADGRLQKEQGNATEILATLPLDYADSLRNATWAKSGDTFPSRLTTEEAENARELEGAGVGNLKLFAMPNNRLALLAPAEDNPASLVLLRSLGGHTARIVAAGMSPKGRFIASIDEQGRVLAWDLLRPAFVREIEKKLADARNVDRNPAQAKQDLENLAKWFNMRGRGDLAQKVVE